MPIELQTGDDLVYQYFQTRRGVFNFKVRSPNDAHLALVTQQSDQAPIIEVFIGGWKNTKSVIRKNRTQPEVAEMPTPDILSAGEFRSFWIRWADNVITVGREGEAAAFLSYEDPDLFDIRYVGVSTGWGASGSWIVDEPISAELKDVSFGGSPCWISSAAGEIPPEAVSGGQDGEVHFVARARHEGALLPGKLVPSHGVTYVAWGGGEHPHDTYEVLCGCSARWFPVSGDAIPAEAMPAGETEDGEPLFVGRVSHEGSVTIGKVHPSHGKLYIPYGGQELAFEDYEILVTH